VTVRTGELAQRRLVQGGTSYISQQDSRRHFGLGRATQADAVEVRWPDGTTSAVQNVKANQIIEIRQSAARQ
jgi:hypothetical protein